jgi:hypothetical protein
VAEEPADVISQRVAAVRASSKDLVADVHLAIEAAHTLRDIAAGLRRQAQEVRAAAITTPTLLDQLRPRHEPQQGTREHTGPRAARTTPIGGD